jgi:hypothetical protein
MTTDMSCRAFKSSKRFFRSSADRVHPESFYRIPFSYFTQWEKELTREEDAYFSEKGLLSVTENYKSKGAKAVFHA